jgi:hypothetical protein
MGFASYLEDLADGWNDRDHHRTGTVPGSAPADDLPKDEEDVPDNESDGDNESEDEPDDGPTPS